MLIFVRSIHYPILHIMNIGTNIKYYREQAKLTQIQLAEQAKISIIYLSKIETSGCDKSLSISVLNQIANVLSVEISEFSKEVE